MRKLFYKWISGSRYLKFHHEIKTALKIIDEYKLYNSNKFFFDNTHADSRNGGTFIIEANDESITICKKSTEAKETYNIFIGNIQIRIENNHENNEQIYSIHIKENNGKDWEFNNVNNEWDYSHPRNKTLRIFVWYDVPVLNIARSVGEVYQGGNWNKYVCQRLDFFTNEIDKCTDSSSFNTMYEESDWEIFKKWVKNIFNKK